MAEVEKTEIVKSVAELTDLASAIHAFQRQFDELRNHLEFVQNVIDAKLNGGEPSPNAEEYFKSLWEAVPKTTLQQQHESEILKEENRAETTKPRSQSSRSSVLFYCESTNGRALRKFLLTKLPDGESLRQELTTAVKSAPRPSRLVLDSVGKFYLQGKKAYNKESPMVSSRKASVLMLEVFLSVIGECEVEIEIEKSVKEEAETAAIAWRKRIINEGGVAKACEIDARGLLLFVACFGIPGAFRNEDVRDLIRFSNLKEIGHLIKKSPVLAPRISDIITNMPKNGLHVDAVNIVYTLGLEDKFSPQTILTSLLRESKEVWKRARKDTPLLMKEANEKHLAALKSVMKCLRDRKIDPMKLLSGWQLKEKIAKLEKDNSELNKKMMDDHLATKRKAAEIEANRLNSLETKRSRFTVTGPSLITSSPSVIALHEQRTPSFSDGKSPYDFLMPNLPSTGFSSRIDSYSTASVLSHGHDPRTLSDVCAPRGGVEIGMPAGNGVAHTNSYAGGIKDEMLVDKVGSMMYGNGTTYGWHRSGDTAAYDRVVAQSSIGQSAPSGAGELYRMPSPSVECFPGLLNRTSTGAGNPNSSSDLYSFADAVL